MRHKQFTRETAVYSRLVELSVAALRQSLAESGLVHEVVFCALLAEREVAAKLAFWTAGLTLFRQRLIVEIFPRARYRCLFMGN